MYLSDFCRFLLCTCGWKRRGERGERGAGEGRGARERGIEVGRVTSYDWGGGGGGRSAATYTHRAQLTVNCTRILYVYGWYIKLPMYLLFIWALYLYLVVLRGDYPHGAF
jgi:hypothetical protein